MSKRRFEKMSRVLNTRQLDLTLITDQVHKGRNLAALIRNCDAMGVDTVHTVVPKAGYQYYRGTALGTEKWVNVEFHDCITDAIHHSKSQGMQILAAHLSADAIHYKEVDYTQPTAIVLGTEKQGVSDEALGMADHHITIPMMGMVDSLNVSVACGIILSEACYQRQKAGYQSPALDTEAYKKRLFEWLQPEMALYCQERGLLYPELDDEGDLVNASEWYQKVRAQ